MTERLREIVAALKTSSTELARAAERLSDHAQRADRDAGAPGGGVSRRARPRASSSRPSSVAASRAASVLDVARRAAEMSSTGQSAAEASVEGLRRIQASVQEISGDPPGCSTRRSR